MPCTRIPSCMGSYLRYFFSQYEHVLKLSHHLAEICPLLGHKHKWADSNNALVHIMYTGE